MEPDRPHLSITLPRNFTFHYQDGQAPRTPEPDMQPEDLQPPPPPRQVLKVRRRRTSYAVPHIMDHDPYDMPLPTIEAPELHSDAAMDLPHMAAFDNEYLTPGISLQRGLSPPKTPVSQMRSLGGYDSQQPWYPATQSESSSRPQSSSGFSDSSISSRGSFESFPSLGGSCTSPDEDMCDPFSFSNPYFQYHELTSPLASQQSRPAKKLKLRAAFTEEMDHHLWFTYMKYLQDPTVTPFKALPSTVPPNGVCHRVARMARKTWKGPRTASAFTVGRPFAQDTPRSGTPDTIKPSKSGSSTPVPGSNKPYLRFPSEKQARKRLRELAKLKPSLSAHYQRLVNNRSPSPFQSSPQDAPASQVLSSPFAANGSSFTTRDLNVSLATSTAASMQFGNPLAQLASDATPQPSVNTWSNARVSAHQKSQSLHIGLGIGNMVGSSFAAMSQMTDQSYSQASSQTWHAPSAQPRRLGSPLQLHAPRPISRPFKRRALHNLEDEARVRGNSFVDQLFGAPAESSHRRVRSRGFSLGDMMEGARRLPISPIGSPLPNPFASLTSRLQDTDGQADTQQQQQQQQQQQPSPQSAIQDGYATVRLGSPFSYRANNTFPRTTTSHAFEQPASFEQRLAGMPNDPYNLSRP